MARSVVITAALVAMLALLASGESTCAQGKAPMSSMPNGFMPGPGEPTFSDDFGGSGGSCNSGYCGECGTCPSDCCSDCDDGCDTGCGNSWGNWCGLGGGQCRWYGFADYLYVRANLSEAVAYLEQNTQDPANSFDIFHELDFQYESSYRVGGGYKLGCCDEEVRFTFTRMSSGAHAVAPVGSFVAYETTSPDGPTTINADVDTKSFDLDYRKTIPLGGSCCECGDACGPCGCGDACCAPSCPAWDITWSGGVRFADVNWDRHYRAVDSDLERFRDTRSTLDFDGGGPRVGLEGRRYFGMKHWCSVFLKGDISLLLGQMQQQVQRLDENDFLTTQTDHGRRIIPVTEIEAGGSAQLTKNSLVSAGYLFSAWHDLGFRDQFNFATQLEDQFDTANILGFDGFFVRLELGY